MPRPAPARALVIEGFGSRLSFGLLTFALPLYAYEMGMSIAAIGLLTSFSAIVSLALKPVMGSYADRWGLRRSLAAALVVRSLMCLSYALATVPWQLFAVRGAHGVSDSLRDPAAHALLAESGGKGSVASTFAWYQTAKTTAGSLGKSLAGVLLATAGGYTLTFGVAFVLSLLPVLAVLCLVPAGRHQHEEAEQTPDEPTPDEPTPPAPDAAASPGVLAFASLGFLVAGTSSMLSALFPVIATEYAGLSTAEAGLLYLITPVLAFTGPAWGWLSDHVSRSLVLSFRGVANICSALVYLFFPTLAGVWVGRSLDDLGKAAFRPAWGSLMAEVSGRDRRHRARVMGYLTSGEDAGDIVAPVLAGLLWTVWGVPVLLGARIGLAACTECYVLWLDRRQRAGASGGDPVGVEDPRHRADRAQHAVEVRGVGHLEREPALGDPVAGRR